MTLEAILNLVRQLSDTDKLRLADAINTELLEPEPECAGLSDETKRMIEERIARLDANPNGKYRTLDEIGAAARARWGR